MISEGKSDEYIIESQKSFLDKYNMGKKFDICLMNPPYDKNLHLKFLEKTIQIAETVVSIQPVRWLQDQTVKDKKKSDYNIYKDSISNHIKSLDIYEAEDCKKFFDFAPTMDLGIYVCDKNGGFDYENEFNNSLLDKIQLYIKNNLCNIEHNKKDGWRVRIVKVIGGGKTGGSGKRKPKLASLGKLLAFFNGERDGKKWFISV